MDSATTPGGGRRVGDVEAVERTYWDAGALEVCPMFWRTGIRTGEFDLKDGSYECSLSSAEIWHVRGKVNFWAHKHRELGASGRGRVYGWC